MYAHASTMVRKKKVDSTTTEAFTPVVQKTVETAWGFNSTFVILTDFPKTVK
jgi:hypothetical protein